MEHETWRALSFAVLGAAAVIVTRQGTRAGAAAGLAVAVVSILGLGPGTLLPLAVFVLGAGALTRMGRKRKAAAGAAEANEGRRGVANVVAKLGLPAILGLAGIVGLERGPLTFAYVAALAASFADTAATEVGLAAGGAVFAFRGGRWERARHGEAGGVSGAGLAGAAAGAAAVTIAALVSGLPISGWAMAGALALAGMAASFTESLVAGTELGRSLGHSGRNVLLTAAAAGLGGAIYYAFHVV